MDNTGIITLNYAILFLVYMQDLTSTIFSFILMYYKPTESICKCHSHPSVSLESQKKHVVTSDALTTWLLISIAFVRWGVQEHDGKDVQVPHAVDASEEGTVHLYSVLSPVPVALIHLHAEKSQIHTLIQTVKFETQKYQKWSPEEP